MNGLALPPEYSHAFSTARPAGWAPSEYRTVPPTPVAKGTLAGSEVSGTASFATPLAPG